MFSFALSDEERLVQETARRFAHDRLLPQLRVHERARGVPPTLVREFVGLGLDVAAGAPGLGAFAKALVLEELAAVDPGAALALDGAGLVRAFVEDATGRGIVVDDVEGRFRVSGDMVSGTHPWVPADAVDVAVIVQGEQALVLRQGLRLEPTKACGLDAAGASRLVAEEAPVAAVLNDADAITRGRARLRVSVAAVLVGAARGALAYAMRYATERTAFGRPIAHHQALAFLIADLATAVDVARLAVWRAATALDRGERAEWEAASALAEAAEEALLVGPSAVQILGGHGFMKDHPVEKWMRDIRTLAQLAGGRDAAEIRLAELAPERHLGLVAG